MNRFHAMTFRILAPGALLILSSAPALWLIDSLQSNPFSAAALSVFRFVPLLLFGAGVLRTFYAIYLLWQCELGKGILCENAAEFLEWNAAGDGATIVSASRADAT